MDDYMHDLREEHLPGEVVERYIQPDPREVVERYTRPLPGRPARARTHPPAAAGRAGGDCGCSCCAWR